MLAKMLKIFQARLQQYVNHELSDVQAGFRKSRGTRDQIANIHWIIEKAIEFQKNIRLILTNGHSTKYLISSLTHTHYMLLLLSHFSRVRLCATP